MKLSVFYDHVLQAAEQTKKPLAVLLRGVRDAGIEAVEINMTYLSEHEETYRLLREAGLKVSCIYEFYAPEQREETARARKHIETAKKAGAERILVVPGFFSVGATGFAACVGDYGKMCAFLEKSPEAERMAEFLAEIAHMGTEAGIAVTVEDFDDKRSPVSCVNGIRWFLERIPDLKITFDTGNFIIYQDDIFAAWEKLKSRVVHVHCKDRAEEAVAVGDGRIPLEELIMRFEQRGYDAYLAIEHFDAADQETAIRRSADFLRRLWDEAAAKG